MNSKVTVYLVGAGPGAPELLTLRGAELLGRADVVMHDSGMGGGLLSHARKLAEFIEVAQPASEALKDALLSRARDGKVVVRLVAGDPYLRSEGCAEAEWLADAGVPFEVVPGIPQAVSVSSQVGIPLTTKSRTPEKPALREQPPLSNRRIVVTRAHDQAGQLAIKLRDFGAEVVEIPVIRVEAPTHREGIVDALLELNSYDWLVFTSPNGVAKFFEYFFKQFHDMRDLGGARIAAVGPGTAKRLKELHLQVDLMPEEALGAKVAEAFSKFESIENLKICLLRAEVANPELPKALEALGAIVDDIPCYRTVLETEDPGGAGAALQREGADWVTFTSGSTVTHFHARFDLPALRKRFPGLRIASIGPETSKALATLGIKPDTEAAQHTLEGLVESLLDAEQKAGAKPSGKK